LGPVTVGRMDGWTPIFRVGTHTDSSGAAKTFARSDLDKTVAAYDPARHEAPLVIGHPKTDSPAYGWVERLRRVGDKAMAVFERASGGFVKNPHSNLRPNVNRRLRLVT